MLYPMATLIWTGVAAGAIGVVAMVAGLVLTVAEYERPRSPAQYVQLISGLSAGLLGIVLPFIGLRYVLVENGEPFRWSLLALLASLPVAIAVVAWLHVTLRSWAVLAVLWIPSLLLLAFAIVGSVTFGFFLLPSALLGIVASVTGSLGRRVNQQNATTH